MPSFFFLFLLFCFPFHSLLRLAETFVVQPGNLKHERIEHPRRSFSFSFSFSSRSGTDADIKVSVGHRGAIFPSFLFFSEEIAADFFLFFFSLSPPPLDIGRYLRKGERNIARYRCKRPIYDDRSFPFPPRFSTPCS